MEPVNPKKHWRQQPLQTAPRKVLMSTVAAGPGSSKSGTNVVPRQVVMEENANQ